MSLQPAHLGGYSFSPCGRRPALLEPQGESLARFRMRQLLMFSIILVLKVSFCILV